MVTFQQKYFSFGLRPLTAVSPLDPTETPQTSYSYRPLFLLILGPPLQHAKSNMELTKNHKIDNHKKFVRLTPGQTEIQYYAKLTTEQYTVKYRHREIRQK